MIVDGTDLIVGRVGTVIAKKALLGEDIVIVNCENMVLTGKKNYIIKSFQRKRSMGTHAKGPFFPRLPDRFVKRMLRGMLPYKKPKGAAALKRIKCYIGTPDEYKDKLETIEAANVKKLKNLNYIKIDELTRLIGAKHGE